MQIYRNMSAKLTYQQQFWREFIKLYESQPCLWNTKLEIYKNRKVKKRAYMILLEKMQEIEPECDIDMVKRKINSFRACYRKKRRILKSAGVLGMDTSEWVYYKYFSFLEDCKDPLEEDEEKNWSYFDESRIAVYEALCQDNMEENDAEMNDTSMEISTEICNSTAINGEKLIPELSSSDGSSKLIPDEEDDGITNIYGTAAQQEFWIEFIKLYESKPVLWKYGSDVYKNRKLKKSAYYEMAEKLREVEPNADVDMVRRKINSLRNVYRRELRKKELALKLGKPEPVINWIYFDYFAFLQNIDSTDDDYNSYIDNHHMTRVDKNCDEDNVEEEDADVYDSLTKITTKASHSIAVNREEPFHYEEDDGIKNSCGVPAQQEFWIEFIKLYESKPELWKYERGVYKDRRFKSSAYYELVEKLRELEPNADVDLVRRKINSFRAIYRREMHKKIRAVRLGKPEPVITWEYFNHFSFLQNKNSLDNNHNSYDGDHTMKVDNNFDGDTRNSDVEEMNIVEEYLSPENNTKPSSNLPTPNQSPKRMRTDSLDITHKQILQPSDEANILAICWAYQYRLLSEKQKLFAKKAIDDILFEARLETLDRHSVKINESGHKKCGCA